MERKKSKETPLGCMSCWDTPLEYNKEKSKKYININHVMNECCNFGSCRLDILEILPLAFCMKNLFPNFSFPYIFFHYLLQSSALSSAVAAAATLSGIQCTRGDSRERAHMGTINYVELTYINFHFLPKLTWLEFIQKLLLKKKFKVGNFKLKKSRCHLTLNLSHLFFIFIDIDPLTKGKENESHKTSNKFQFLS